MERGYRQRHVLFVSANIALIVIAGLHTWGTLAGGAPDAAGQAVETAMRSHRIDTGFGMQPSVSDIQFALALTMSITLTGIALLNLLLLGPGRTNPSLIKRSSLASVLIISALLVLYAVERVAPPLITLAVVDVLFVLAWMVTRPETA